MQDKLDTKPGEGAVDNKEKDLLVDSQSSSSSLDQISNSGISHERSLDINCTEANTNTGLNEEVQSPPTNTPSNSSQEENEMKTVPPPHFTTQDRGEVLKVKEIKLFHISAFKIWEQNATVVATALQAVFCNMNSHVYIFSTPKYLKVQL